MRSEKKFIEGPAGKLEIQENLQFDRNSNSERKNIGIILCSPYPPMGGTMTFSLLHKLFYILGDNNYPVIRFNYRGVGQSEGKFSGNLGSGEIQDTLSICSYMKSQIPTLNKICVIGYSFGAAIAAATSDKMDSITGWIGISPPVTMFPELFNQGNLSKPKFLIIGDQDDFTPINAFQYFYNQINNPKTMQIVIKQDHFWNLTQNPGVKSINSLILDWLTNFKF